MDAGTLIAQVYALQPLYSTSLNVYIISVTLTLISYLLKPLAQVYNTRNNLGNKDIFLVDSATLHTSTSALLLYTLSIPSRISTLMLCIRLADVSYISSGLFVGVWLGFLGS